MYESAKDILIPITAILVSILVAYWTAIYAVHRESDSGRLRLLELVRRYFLNVLNTIVPGTDQTRQDALAKEMYVEELKAILVDLQSLVANPYFGLLVARYSLISKLIVQVRREIVEHRSQQSFALNAGTLTAFGNLHLILSKELPKLTNSELDQVILKLTKSNAV